jgi:hypothetical protein
MDCSCPDCGREFSRSDVARMMAAISNQTKRFYTEEERKRRSIQMTLNNLKKRQNKTKK